MNREQPVRSSLVVRPVVRSERGRRALEASLRRLGVDERTLADLASGDRRSAARPA
ncbi:hypothetical protein GCM10028777_01210 [Angustibacter speluncae]